MLRHLVEQHSAEWRITDRIFLCWMSHFLLSSWMSFLTKLFCWMLWHLVAFYGEALYGLFTLTTSVSKTVGDNDTRQSSWAAWQYLPWPPWAARQEIEMILIAKVSKAISDHDIPGIFTNKPRQCKRAIRYLEISLLVKIVNCNYKNLLFYLLSIVEENRAQFTL